MNKLASTFKRSLDQSTANTLNTPLLQQYRENLKLFVKKVQKEVSQLIQKYESQIKQLKLQNFLLKEKLNKSKYEHNPQQSTLMRQKNLRNISPIKSKIQTNFQNTKLSLTTPFKNSFNQSNTNHEVSRHFQTYDDLSSSRFQAEKNKKKQIQNNLLVSLQSGKSNLENNTSKLLDLLGKNKKPCMQQQQDQNAFQAKSQQLRVEDALNSSLSLVCESLDNSFHSKKSKKKHQIRRKQKERLKKMKIQEAKNRHSQRKQQGLKNLLQSLRVNISSTEQKPLQTIKNLKLAVGQEQQNNLISSVNSQKSPGKSKVLINPIPIDISNKKKGNLSFEQQKKPQSILKKSETILSKSILSNLSFS